MVSQKEEKEMLVTVKLGNQVIQRCDSKGEISTERARNLLKYAKSGMPSEVLDLLLQNDRKTMIQMRGCLNPEFFWEDKVLDWQLESLLNLNVKPNFSERFTNEFFPTGYIAGELYVLSGISGGGKTSMAVQIATTLASGFNVFSEVKSGDKATVMYVTLEQNKRQIQARIMSNLMATLFGKTDLHFSKILSGTQSFSQDFQKALMVFSMLEDCLRILDFNHFGGSPTVDQLMNVVSDELEKINDNEKKLLIIDRYENIVGASSNVDDSVARELKNFAIQHDIPILLQCQLSKNAIEAAKTSDGKFNLDKISASSLKGTSGLEHQCSNVMILVPDLRLADKDQKVVTVIQPKNRYGLNQAIKLNFLGSCGLFTEFVETRGRKKKEDETKEKEFDRKETE